MEAKADDEPDVPQKQEGGFSFFRKTITSVVEQPKEEQKDEEGENAEEVPDGENEEGLLTFDQSMNEDDQKPGEDASVDEMFLVNQIKAQYI